MPGIPPNSLFSAFAFVGFILAGLPLPWHMYLWHTGAWMYMLWTSLGCLILFVNSIVWNDNVANSAPVWCDISSRFLIGGSVGIPASSFCIIHRLYYLTKPQTISISVGKKTKRREVMVDLSIGIGFPCVVMALQYIVQSRRFIIFEQIGCFPFVTDTPAAYLLVLMWPLVIGSVSFVYAVLTFRWAFRQKQELKKMLRAGFFISTGHYWRLMALCSVEIIFTVPLSIFFITRNVAAGVGPYVSWSSMHAGISHIVQDPTVDWQSVQDSTVSLETTRWFYVLCALVIFSFFGWVEEARDFYCQAFRSVYRRLGQSKASRRSLPTNVNQQMRSKHVARARTGCCSLSLDAPPRPESYPSFSSRLSADQGIESPPRLPPLSTLAYSKKTSWESLIATPKPVLLIGQRVQDIGQLV